jgi:hypothetical protein
MAGSKNIITQGEKRKNLSRLAYPYSRILLSKTHMKRPQMSKNTIIAIYPIRELKNEFNSFLRMLTIMSFLKGGKNNQVYSKEGN